MSDLYFCPTAREVESGADGGFAVCCDRPQDHIPMPDTPGTAAVSEALSAAARREFALKQQLAELNNAITWDTTCLNCSRLLTRSYEDYCRAEALTGVVLAVSNELTQSGVHDAAGRLSDALDRYQETASTAPEFPLPIRSDGTHYYVSTYCAHGLHGDCRITCKHCPSVCACETCGHQAPVVMAVELLRAPTTPDGPTITAGFDPGIEIPELDAQGIPLRTPATRDLTAEERQEMAMSLVFAMQALQPAAEPVLCHHPDAVHSVRETMEAGWGRKVIRVVRCPACPAWAESDQGEPTMVPWMFNAERCTEACTERHTNGPGCLMRPVWPGAVAGPETGSKGRR